MQCINWSSHLAKKMGEDQSVIVIGTQKNLSYYVILSLVQVMMEPYYRTLAGFCKLIEKEWVLFSYPFYGTDFGFYNNTRFFQE